MRGCIQMWGGDVMYTESSTVEGPEGGGREEGPPTGSINQLNLW